MISPQDIPHIDEVAVTPWESTSLAIKMLDMLAESVCEKRIDDAFQLSQVLTKFRDSHYCLLDQAGKQYVEDCQESLIVAAHGVMRNDDAHFRLGYDGARTQLAVLNNILNQRPFDPYSLHSIH